MALGTTMQAAPANALASAGRYEYICRAYT